MSPVPPARRIVGAATAAALLASAAIAATDSGLGEAAAQEAPPSPAVLIDEVTGAAATTDTRTDWNVGATDLGIMWEDGSGNVLTAFGDTFLNPGSDGAGVDEWRSNILLRSSDRNLSDGMSFDWALTDENGHAKEMFASKKVDNDEMTTIPTAGIEVDGRQYVEYMSVRHWGDPGEWDTNFSQLAYSDDGGQTWSIDGAPHWDNPDGTDPMQMKAFAKDGEYIYVYGTPNGRLGDAHLARVLASDMMDKEAYEYYTGSDWTSDYSAIEPLIDGPVAELSVRQDPSSGLWQMIYLDGNADLVLRIADSPEGEWGAPQVLATQKDYPGLYGGYIHPWSSDGEIYFLMSMWNAYNVALMKVTIDNEGQITYPNLLVDPSFEQSGALDVPSGWRPTSAGGIDTQSAWAKVGQRQFWVRSNGGEHLMTQNVEVTPYTDYKLTGWLTTGDSAGGNAGEGRIGARINDAGMPVLAEETFGDLNGYTKFEVEFNSGEHSRIQVFAGSTMTADRWVQGDDFSLVALGEPTQEPPPPGDEAPAVIPALSDWTSAEGDWTLNADTRIVGPAEFADSAALLAEEIATYRSGDAAAYVNDGATAADIEVAIDDGRTDLGEEGYELTIGPDGVTITAATRAGAFYGTRTVSQMLRQDTTIPAGTTVDMPKYPERGLTISAYEVNVSEEWIDRMLMDMADLKLNQILLQIKMKSDKYPGLNTWSYYTKDQVRDFVEKANSYGIEVIPEINAPGHMSVVLENYPEYQLVDDDGNHQPTQLDVCNPEAIEFYMDLMDEYVEVFQPTQWHIGSDEYMLGRDPANYTHLIDCVEDRFGADAVDEQDPFATINNVVFDFINQVNAHAKDDLGLEGLRMWNDGLRGSTQVEIDTDITVEHWIDHGMPPSDIVADGHPIMNASLLLYDTRSPNNQPVINAENLWNTGWYTGQFFGSHGTLDADDPKLVGLKASMWVDSAWAQTENYTEERVREGLRVVSQMGWTATHEGLSWDEFQSHIEGIGRSPEWKNVNDQPLAAGSYRISLLDDPTKVLGETGVDPETLGIDSWILTPTPDRYYQIRSSVTGECLAMSEGFETLGTVTEIGAGPNFEACGSIDDQLTNKQKWQIVDDGSGGYRIANATTNAILAVTVGDEVRPHRYLGGVEYPETTLPAGELAQLPGDVTDDRWVIEPAVSVVAEADRSQMWVGETATVTLTITNSSDAAMTGVELVPQLPEGWELEDVPAIADIPAGETVTFELTLRDMNAAPGQAFLPFTVKWDDGLQSAGLIMEVTCGEPASPDFVSVSDEQTWGEAPGSGPGAAAVDGDPDTYWHSNWDGENTPYPHHIVVDTGEVQEICGLSYLPRAGATAGRAATYEIYVSDDGENWGEPITGELEHRFGWQQIPVGAEGRYIKFVGTSSWPEDDAKGLGNPWMSVAELMYASSAGETLPGTSTVPEMVPAIVTVEGDEVPDPDDPVTPDPDDPVTPEPDDPESPDPDDGGTTPPGEKPKPGLPDTGV